MKKILTLLSLAALMAFATPTTAQEKKMFTPADASYNNRSLYAQRPNQLKWVGNSDNYMLVKDNQIVTITAGKAKETTLLNLDQLNGFNNQANLDSLRRMPNLTWMNDNEAYFYALGKGNINLNVMNLKAKA